MMGCKWSSADAEVHASDLMEHLEAVEYRRHLGDCPGCSAAMASSRQLRASLDAMFASARVPRHVISHVFAAGGSRVEPVPKRRQWYRNGSTPSEWQLRAQERLRHRAGRARAFVRSIAMTAALMVVFVATIAWSLSQSRSFREFGTAAPSLTDAPQSTVPPAQSVVASAPSIVTPAQSSWEALRQRPLNLPTLGPTGTCPTTPMKRISPSLAGGRTAPTFGFGSGPVYLSGIVFFYPTGLNNTVWLSEPGYQGPILVRGHQLNGSTPVGFSAFSDSWATGQLLGSVDLHATDRSGNDVSVVSNVKVYGELDLPSASGAPSSHWRMWLTRTHIERPGCYAVQVDGPGFSESIVFQALSFPPAGG
jgi:hypothetical protein